CAALRGKKSPARAKALRLKVSSSRKNCITTRERTRSLSPWSFPPWNAYISQLSSKEPQTTTFQLQPATTNSIGESLANQELLRQNWARSGTALPKLLPQNLSPRSKQDVTSLHVFRTFHLPPIHFLPDARIHWKKYARD